MREQLPDLPELEPEALAELRTIRLIAGFIGGATDTAAPAANGAHAPLPTPAPAPQPTAGTNGTGGVTEDMLRALISDKTGYPPEMLEVDMDLEGELGIDSIKQVEILSAVRESVPELPEIESEQLGELRTIRGIVDFFR